MCQKLVLHVPGSHLTPATRVDFGQKTPSAPLEKNFFQNAFYTSKGTFFFFASVTAKKILRPPASPDKIALLPPSKKNFFLKYVLHVKGNILFFFR